MGMEVFIGGVISALVFGVIPDVFAQFSVDGKDGNTPC
jgi:hypothetical protein